jgi:response regulator RpfG family c-di-GMP phosphodiesterase
MTSISNFPAIAVAENGHNSSSRARILVTDDRPEMLAAIDVALGRRYECEFAPSVGSAREKLRDEEFKLAICDVDAAGELAMALAEEIIAEHPETAVVLVTGQDDPRVADRAFALGVHGYLVEPLRSAQLLITVMNALRWRDLEIGKAAHARSLAEQFQTIIDMAPIPIHAKDGAHRYFVANAKADELLGNDPGGAIGKTDRDLMDPTAAEEVWQADRSILEGAEPAFEADHEMLVGDVTKTLHTVKFPLLDERGKVAAVGGISIDITSQREALRLRDELTASQQKAIDEMRLSREEMVERLVRAIEHHDPSTGLHVIRIGAIASFLASRLGLDPERAELLRVAAPMHDVGKIGTPEEILRKPGPLTSDERIEMQRHAVIGHEILADSQSELLRIAATIALTHHECFDGSGYPLGLVGTEIPIEGRITAVADVFDALLSDRCYRPGLPLEEAVEVMRGGRGTQFDPRIVDIALAHVDELIAIRG